MGLPEPNTPNLPRLKERDNLVKAVKETISGQPGPFAYGGGGMPRAAPMTVSWWKTLPMPLW